MLLSLTATERYILFSLCFTGLIPLPLSIVFFCRRHLTPIKERMPLTSIIGANFYVLCATLNLLGKFAPTSCYEVYSYFALFESLQQIEIAAFASRYYVHYLGYRLCRAKILATVVEPSRVFAFGSRDTEVIAVESPSRFDAWLLKNKWVISNKFLAPFWFIILLCVIIYISVFFLSLDWNDLSCTDTRQQEFYFMPWYLFWVAVYGILAYKMRIVVDGFHIKAEILLQFRLALVIFICYGIPPLYDNEYNGGFPLISVIYWMVTQITFISTIIMPIYWSYKESYFQNGHNMEICLDDIIEHQDTLDAFQQFLATEFCIENLYFLLSIRNLKQMEARLQRQSENQSTSDSFSFITNEEISAAIRHIYEVFCLESSPFQINISANTLASLQRKLDMGDSSCFENAVKEIRCLLEMNSLGRFLNSPLGMQCIQKINKTKALWRLSAPKSQG